MPTNFSLCMFAAAVFISYEYGQNMALIAGSGRYASAGSVACTSADTFRTCRQQQQAVHTSSR